MLNRRVIGTRDINLNVINKTLGKALAGKQGSTYSLIMSIKSKVEALDSDLIRLFKNNSAKLSSNAAIDYRALKRSFNEDYAAFAKEIKSNGIWLLTVIESLSCDTAISNETKETLKTIGYDLIRLSQFVPEFRYSKNVAQLSNLCIYLGGYYIQIGQGNLPSLGIEETTYEDEETHNITKEYSESKGGCAGLQQQWAYEIATKGTPTYPTTSTMKVLQYQETQHKNRRGNYTLLKTEETRTTFHKLNTNDLLSATVLNAPYELIIEDDTTGHSLGIRRHKDFFEIYDPNYGYFFFRKQNKAAIWLDVLLQRYYATDFPCDMVGLLMYTAVNPADIKPSTFPSSSELDKSAALPFTPDGYAALVKFFQQNLVYILKHAKKGKLVFSAVKALNSFADCASDKEREELLSIVECLQQPEKELDDTVVKIYFESSALYEKFKNKISKPKHAATLATLTAKLQAPQHTARMMPDNVKQLINEVEEAERNYRILSQEAATLKHAAEQTKQTSEAVYQNNKLEILAMKLEMLRKAKIVPKLKAALEGELNYDFDKAVQDFREQIGEVILSPAEYEPHLSELTTIDKVLAQLTINQQTYATDSKVLVSRFNLTENLRYKASLVRGLHLLQLKNKLALQKSSELTAYRRRVLQTKVMTANDDIRDHQFDDILNSDNGGDDVYITMLMQKRKNTNRDQTIASLENRLLGEHENSCLSQLAALEEKVIQHESISVIHSRTVNAVFAMQGVLFNELHQANEHEQDFSEYEKALKSLQQDIDGMREQIRKTESTIPTVIAELRKSFNNIPASDERHALVRDANNVLDKVETEDQRDSIDKSNLIGALDSVNTLMTNDGRQLSERSAEYVATVNKTNYGVGKIVAGALLMLAAAAVIVTLAVFMPPVCAGLIVPLAALIIGSHTVCAGILGFFGVRELDKGVNQCQHQFSLNKCSR